MALEAGATMHQVFAATRIWQLEFEQGLPFHAQFNGERLFGIDRWREINKAAASHKDHRESVMEAAFATLHSSGFYDDPGDTMRTMSNMESASLHYIDERLQWMPDWPIFVESFDDPECLVGVEQTFDVVLTFADGHTVRYIGTIDGLSFSNHYQRHFLDENKTASRLDTGWRRSFEMSHQITGYCAASTTVFGFPVFDAHVFGVKLKPTGRLEDSYTFMVERTGAAIQRWAAWVRWTADLGLTFENDFENAPRFTHSCNRYFRACSLLSFCADSPEGRAEQYLDMVETPPSPSERAVMEQF